MSVHRSELVAKQSHSHLFLCDLGQVTSLSNLAFAFEKEINNTHYMVVVRIKWDKKLRTLNMCLKCNK